VRRNGSRWQPAEARRHCISCSLAVLLSSSAYCAACGCAGLEPAFSAAAPPLPPHAQGLGKALVEGVTRTLLRREITNITLFADGAGEGRQRGSSGSLAVSKRAHALVPAATPLSAASSLTRHCTPTLNPQSSISTRSWATRQTLRASRACFGARGTEAAPGMRLNLAL
jgi:hypothetical protein